MPTGAAPQVADRLRARVTPAGVALGLLFAVCHPSRPAAPGAHDAGGAAPTEVTAPVPPPPRGKHLVVAYSSNILGEYEPCG